jgi:hypothetical protein
MVIAFCKNWNKQLSYTYLLEIMKLENKCNVICVQVDSAFQHVVWKMFIILVGFCRSMRMGVCKYGIECLGKQKPNGQHNFSINKKKFIEHDELIDEFMLVDFENSCLLCSHLKQDVSFSCTLCFQFNWSRNIIALILEIFVSFFIPFAILLQNNVIKYIYL